MTTTDTIHRATSPDGTEIAGRVLGDGPPLVLVPGGPGDGEQSWQGLVPHLAPHAACHCLSTRGKGLSADHPDHSIERYAEDVAAYVNGIGEPVCLFGHSSGAVVAMEAAARTNAVTSLALYEPADFTTMTASHRASFEDAVVRARRAIENGRPADAAEIFFVSIALSSDEELAAVAAAGVYDVMAPNIPSVLQHVRASGPPHLLDPELPGRLDMPVLLLQGSDTHPFYTSVVASLAGQIPDVAVRTIPGAGHLGPQLVGEAVAAELVSFIAATS